MKREEGEREIVEKKDETEKIKEKIEEEKEFL